MGDVPRATATGSGAASSPKTESVAPPMTGFGASPMTEFVAGVVRVAFLVRLATLPLALLMPVSVLTQGQVVGVVLVIATTSIVGFYRHESVARLIRDHPIVAAVDVLVAAGITALIGADSPLTFYTLSTALLVGVLSSPVNTILLTIILAGSQLVAVLESVPAREDLFLAVVTPASCVVLVVLGSVTRVLHEQVLAEQEEAARLRAEASRLAERVRLARDLHDSVAKSLHGIGLAAAALPVWLNRDPTSGRERALEIKCAADAATQQARAMLSELRDDADERPLWVQLRAAADVFGEQHGLVVRAALAADVDLPTTARNEVIRIVDEALENIARHAGAGTVELTCRLEGPDLVVEISDNGSGFDVAAGTGLAGHFGLEGMAERARVAGGQLRINSHPGSGTTVRVEVPTAAAMVDDTEKLAS